MDFKNKKRHCDVADSLHLAKPGGWCAVALVCGDSSSLVFSRAWSSNVQFAHAGLITSLEPQAIWVPLIWWHDMAGLPVRYCSQIISPFGGMGLLAILHTWKKAALKRMTKENIQYSVSERLNKTQNRKQEKISMINEKVTFHGMIKEMRVLLPPVRKISHGVFMNPKEVLMCG